MRSDRTACTTADEVAVRVRALLGDGAGTVPIDDTDVGVGTEGGADDWTVPDDRNAHLDRMHESWHDRLLSRLPVRVDPGRRGALAVGVTVLVVAIVCGAWLLSSRPQSVPLRASAPSVPRTEPLVGTDGATADAASPHGSGSVAPASVGSPSASRVVVDVAGRVRHPGVYRLPPGSRIDDALRAAGGPVGHVDLSRLDLAAPLVDGEQVPVGVRSATGVPVAGASPAPGDVSGGSSPASAPVDLNTADLGQLESLPGVGPVLGQDILDYRNAHGSFSSIEQLQDVSGIGDVKFGELKALVTV